MESMYIVRGVTKDGTEVFYTGRAGEGFTSKLRGESFGYVSQLQARERAKNLNRAAALHGVHFIAIPYEQNPMLTGQHEREARENPSDGGQRVKLFAGMTTELDQFEAMVRFVCPVGGNPDEYGVRLGNVEFWIDSEGPWAGKLSHSIPTSQWDSAKVSSDLTAKLVEYGWGK